MNKILICLFALCLALSSKAQYPISQNLGNANTLINIPPNGAITGIPIVRSFADTTAANLTFIKPYAGALIRVVDTIFMRSNGRWTPVSGAGSGGVPTTIINYITNYVDSSAVTFVTNSGIDSIKIDGYDLIVYYPDTTNVFHLSRYIDSGYLSVDSLEYVLTRSGVPAFTLPTLLKSFAAGDSCISLRDSSNGVTYFYFNQNCGGGGGIVGPYVDSVKVRDDSLQVVYNHTGGNDTTVWRGGGGSGGITLPQLTDSLNGRIDKFGIQDNLGLQDRFVDMQKHYFSVDNSSSMDMTSRDASNNYANINTDATVLGKPIVYIGVGGSAGNIQELQIQLQLTQTY